MFHLLFQGVKRCPHGECRCTNMSFTSPETVIHSYQRQRQLGGRAFGVVQDATAAAHGPAGLQLPSERWDLN